MLLTDWALIYQDVEVQDEITREFARRLCAQHGSNTDVPNQYIGDKFPGFKFPLHVLTRQAWDGKRPWSDVDLFLQNLPPQMAKDALMRQDGLYKEIPLHLAAWRAPRPVIDRMLTLARDAARLKNSIGTLPLHLAARYNNNIDAIESLVNAYTAALLETNNYGDTPIDKAISKGHGDEFLRKMFLETMKLACSDTFLNYGELLEDKSLYKQSINPISLIFIEAIHKKRSPDDVVEFIDQLKRKPAVLGAFLHHAKEEATEPSPANLADIARTFDFKTKNARTRVVNALSGDNKEGLALHNASTGLDDSPDVPDRLGRQPLAKACAQVLKEIETPHTSFTCSVTGGWGSGKTKFADMLVKEMMKRNKNIKKEPETLTFTPTLTFIIVCILVKKYLYDMCLGRCLLKSSRSAESENNNVADSQQSGCDQVKKYLYDMCLYRCLLKPSRSENMDQTADPTNTESHPLLDLEPFRLENMDQTPDASRTVSNQTNSESGPLLHVGSDADYDLTHLDMREWLYLLTFPISFPASYVYNLFQTGKIFSVQCIHLVRNSYKSSIFLGRTGPVIDEESGDDVQKLDENGEAMIIALCIILLSPVVLLTMMFYYIVIKTGTVFSIVRMCTIHDISSVPDEYRTKFWPYTKGIQTRQR